MQARSTPEEEHLARVARPVVRTLAPNDAMFEADEEHYFRVGRSALRVVRTALATAGLGDPRRVLDLPCGHGRVLRALHAAWPAAELTACDLDRDGVDFCARTFGARPVYSELDPARVPLARGSFDLIWVGSLLTHLPRTRWPGFLRCFWDWVEPRGLVVLTTLGRYAAYRLEQGVTYGLGAAQHARLLEEFAREGFGYAPYSAEADYGLTLASPGFVLRALEALPLARIVSFGEMAWDEHQDVAAIQKMA